MATITNDSLFFNSQTDYNLIRKNFNDILGRSAPQNIALKYKLLRLIFLKGRSRVSYNF